MEALKMPSYWEETDGSPIWIIAIDRVCLKQLAAPQQTAGHRPGAVELRHRLHPLVRAWHAGHLSGSPAAPEGRDARTALVRLVFGGAGQERRQTARPRSHALLRASVVL